MGVEEYDYENNCVGDIDNGDDILAYRLFARYLWYEKCRRDRE